MRHPLQAADQARQAATRAAQRAAQTLAQLAPARMRLNGCMNAMDTAYTTMTRAASVSCGGAA